MTQTDSAKVQELETLVSYLVLQAQCHAMEARTANSTIYEAYQAATGGTGEPGNWHGAKPIIERFERDRQTIETLVSALKLIAGHDGLTLIGPVSDTERFHASGAAKAFADMAEIARDALTAATA